MNVVLFVSFISLIYLLSILQIRRTCSIAACLFSQKPSHDIRTPIFVDSKWFDDEYSFRKPAFDIFPGKKQKMAQKITYMETMDIRDLRETTDGMSWWYWKNSNFNWSKLLQDAVWRGTYSSMDRTCLRRRKKENLSFKNVTGLDNFLVNLFINYWYSNSIFTILNTKHNTNTIYHSRQYKWSFWMHIIAFLFKNHFNCNLIHISTDLNAYISWISFHLLPQRT